MRRPTISYANVASTLALVVATSGGAMAAQHYVITSKSQIAPTVRKQLSKPGPVGPAGTTGATGPQGPKGADGAPGAKGATGGSTAVVRVVSGSVDANAGYFGTAKCNTGETAVGGGMDGSPDHAVKVEGSRPGKVNGTTGGIGIGSSRPATGDVSNAWTVVFTNTTTSAQTVYVYAVCEATS